MLTLIERECIEGKFTRKALYKCDCGNTKWMDVYNVNSKKSVTCGCFNTKRIANINKKHGLRHHPLYTVWGHMKRRCLNNNNPAFHWYGGRGITVCDEWKTDFTSFYNWSIANGWQKGLQLDRRDNDGNYCPENCRFVTSKVNNNNKRCNRLITYKEQTKTLTEWADIVGKDMQLIWNRLDHGWSVDRALTI